MQPQAKPLPQLVEIYAENHLQQTDALFYNVDARRPHTLSLSVARQTAVMELDRLQSSRAEFRLARPSFGSFSLASNSGASNKNRGSFRSIRLSAKGQTLLDLNFETVGSVRELEAYFDCYLFSSLRQNTHGQRVPLTDFWALNDQGHLICVQPTHPVRHSTDYEDICLLTLRGEPIGDFELSMDFDQCWQRYGVVFGCPAGCFPYFYNENTRSYVAVEGCFAYAEAEGYRTMRGNLAPDSYDQPATCIRRVLRPALPSFTAAESIVMHTHGQHTLLYHVEGNGKYLCAGQALPCTSGCITYFPPCTAYQPAYTVDKHIAILFETAHGLSDVPLSILPQDTERLQRSINKLMDLYYNNQLGSWYKCHAIFYEILSQLFDGAPGDSNKIPELIAPAVRYIQNHLSDPALSVAQLAKLSNISEVYFRQVFKESMGITPKKYILNKRIDYAVFLLVTFNYNISEVAEKCGFADTKYFITTFKRATGFSPRQYVAQYPGAF